MAGTKELAGASAVLGFRQLAVLIHQGLQLSSQATDSAYWKGQMELGTRGQKGLLGIEGASVHSTSVDHCG